MLSVSVFAVGCSVVTAPDDVKENALTERRAMIDKRDFRHSASNVFHFDTMYVEPLTLEESELPKWFYKKVDSSFAGLPLQNVLRKALKNLPVNIEYRPGVDLQTKIHISKAEMTIGEMLDSISGSTGYQYSINEKSVVINKFDTRYYQVRMPLGATEYSIGKKEMVGANRQEGGGESATSDMIASAGEEYSIVSGQHSTLKDMMSGVEVILGCKNKSLASDTELKGEAATGAKDNEASDVKCDHDAFAQVMHSDNTIMVKAIPSQHEAVERYISNKTELSLRQVRVNVTLMSVEVSKDTQLNLDFNITDANLFGNVGINDITNAAASVIGGLDTPGTTTFAHENGSQAAIDSLNKQGTILQRIIMRGSSMNNRVTQLTSINKVSYVASRELQQTANVGATTGIEQKVAESGSILYILPNIGESDVVLHVSTSQSALTRLDKKGTLSNEVESPVIDDKFLNTTVRIKPGRPIFIGGFTSNELQAVFAQSGVVSPGYQQSSVDKNVETVMMVDVEFL